MSSWEVDVSASRREQKKPRRKKGAAVSEKFSGSAARTAWRGSIPQVRPRPARLRPVDLWCQCAPAELAAQSTTISTIFLGCENLGLVCCECTLHVYSLTAAGRGSRYGRVSFCTFLHSALKRFASGCCRVFFYSFGSLSHLISARVTSLELELRYLCPTESAEAWQKRILSGFNCRARDLARWILKAKANDGMSGWLFSFESFASTSVAFFVMCDVVWRLCLRKKLSWKAGNLGSRNRSISLAALSGAP